MPDDAHDTPDAAAAYQATSLQAQLEALLGFDADSEVQGTLDVDQDPPAPCVMLTEAAAERVIEMLKKAGA